jgi:primosomal protein N' (replication factor Y) (superfamily II helicase)
MGGVAQVARVLPDVAGFERELDYEVPPGLEDEIRPGSIVRVPLQGRTVRGWVVAYPAEPPEAITLRPLAKVSGWGPEPAVLDLASWAAWRWAGRRRSLLVTASPQTAVKHLAVVKHLAAPAGNGPRGEAGSRETPAGPVTASAAGATRGPGPASSSPARDMVEEAWRPGAHVLRLPPVYSATEVVLAAASHGPVLVVAPTAARAEAGGAALRRTGFEVAVLPQGWAQARSGGRLVIGARASVWGPCPGLASIVVLEAHDEALVQEQAPTWDAPSVAAERARRADVPCLWVTSCPTLELIAAADHVHLPSRSAERGGWAAVRVVDRRPDDPRSGLYSEELVQVLRSGCRVVCVLNRKGRALLPICGACAEPARCEQCGSAVALLGDELFCRRCGTSRPIVCASCGSDSLRLLRVGVSRARDQLEALAGRPVGEVVAGTGPLPATPVLVGTEAVLYREAELRRAGGVGAVAFLDFDQELLAPRYRAGEEALALLSRASRLLGGRQEAGTLLVQTRLPHHAVLEAASLADPGRLTSSEEPVRKTLRLPPFSALAILSGPGAAALAGLLEKVHAAGSDGTTTVHGEPARQPDPDHEGAVPSSSSPPLCPRVEVLQLAPDRWVVRARDHPTLADALAAAGRPAERVRVEVGPVRF